MPQHRHEERPIHTGVDTQIVSQKENSHMLTHAVMKALSSKYMIHRVSHDCEPASKKWLNFPNMVQVHTCPRHLHMIYSTRL